jgi:hypothetical protein
MLDYDGVAIIDLAKHGLRRVWLEPRLFAKLEDQRRPDESYSDVILRLAAVGRDPLNGS